MSSSHEFLSPAPISSSEYDFICKLVYEQSRIRLGPNKRELVMARLSKRLRSFGFKTYGQYCQLLKTAKGEDEIGDLIDAISTNHTFFFRETSHFDFLKTDILPNLVSVNGRPPRLRIWSAACSTGEEPYSLALLLAHHNFALPAGQKVEWSIDCTDISSRVLKKAEEGVFAAERLKDVPRTMVDAYFHKVEEEHATHYCVNDDLKKHMSFQRLNLLAPSYPFKVPYDLIVCRNVMIYFDKPTQSELVNKLWPLIHPGGHLFIGHAESLTGTTHNYKMLKPAIYQRPA